MARISGVDIPKQKRGVIALTYIYGIGLSSAQKIWRSVGLIDVRKRVKDLCDQDLIKLRNVQHLQIK